MCLDIEVEQPCAFNRELVDAWRGRAAQYAAAVTANLSVTKIIHQDKNNVRFTRRSLGGGGLFPFAGRLRSRLCVTRFDRHQCDT